MKKEVWTELSEAYIQAIRAGSSFVGQPRIERGTSLEEALQNALRKYKREVAVEAKKIERQRATVDFLLENAPEN